MYSDNFTIYANVESQWYIHLKVMLHVNYISTKINVNNFYTLKIFLFLGIRKWYNSEIQKL